MNPKESLLRKTQGIWKSFQNTGNFVCSSYQFLGSNAKMKYIVIFAGQFYNIFSQGLNVFAKSKPHMKQWEITEICKGKMWLDRDIITIGKHKEFENNICLRTLKVFPVESVIIHRIYQFDLPK